MSAGDRSTIIEDEGALAALEAEWWELWRRCPSATPFGSPAWAIPWWQAFRPGTLAVATVRRDGRLVAMAPMYREDGQHGCRLLPIGIGISDHLDVLLEPEAGASAAASLVAAVATIPGWQRWELEELPPDASALSLPGHPGWLEESGDQSACPVLALDARDPFAAVPARQRRKARMAQHRAARRGATVVVAEPDEMPAFMSDLDRLHAARWETRGEGGVLADERVQHFHALALPRLAAAGLVRAATLRIENRVAGAFYGFRHTGRAYAYVGGFDPDFAFESPGTILLADAIESGAREGASEFHFLRGRESYKYAWGAVDRLNRRRSFNREAGS